MIDLLKKINKDVAINGWVKKNRKLGDIIFIDIRNINGLLQIVIEKNNDFFSLAKSLKNEDVVEVFGKIRKRKNINEKIETGNIELLVSKIKVISRAIQTPLIIDDETDALEKIRMEYRYLDLRRPINQKMLIFRSNFIKNIRNYFYDLNFKEIETPIITKPSFGGANELKIRSINHPEKEYSLVQSPQIYKQLLMYSGIDKYFQIAKCFRDEDSRSDRQLEFTQLDIEINFTNIKKIKDIIENLIIFVWKKMLNFEIKKNEFLSISYDNAINNYGSDKPDLRIKEKIYDITDILLKSNLDFLKKDLNTKSAKIFVVDEDISNSFFKEEEKIVKSENGNKIYWSRIEKDKSIKGSIKNIDEKTISKINSLVKKSNYTLFLIIDDNNFSLELIGRLRNRVAEKLNLIQKDQFKFVWIEDWPLFELDDNKKIISTHNPFTNLTNEDLIKFNKIDLKKINKNELTLLKSLSFDLVLNGSEIGGGAMRINDINIQKKVFNVLGLTNEEIDQEFGWFLNAQKFGIPEHGGIALGLDRILSIMLNKETIKEVIAFPKSTKGTDEMTKSPIDIINK